MRVADRSGGGDEPFGGDAGDREGLALVLGLVADQDHVVAVHGRSGVGAVEGLGVELLEGLEVEEVDHVLALVLLDVGPHLLLRAVDLDRGGARHLGAVADHDLLLGLVDDPLEGVAAQDVQEGDGGHGGQEVAHVDQRHVAVDGGALDVLPHALHDVLAVAVEVVEEDADLVVQLGVAQGRELDAPGGLVLGVDGPADLVRLLAVDLGGELRAVALADDQHGRVRQDGDVEQLDAARLRAVDGVEDEGDVVAVRVDGVPGQDLGVAGLREDLVAGLGVLQALEEELEQVGALVHWTLRFGTRAGWNSLRNHFGSSKLAQYAL